MLRFGIFVALAAIWTYSCHTIQGRLTSLLSFFLFVYWIAPRHHPLKQLVRQVVATLKGGKFLSNTDPHLDETTTRNSTSSTTTTKRKLRNKRYLCTDRFHEKKIPPKVDTVVIGSGMSGLTCAAILSRLGRRVLVLEQHTVAGGGTHTFEFKGFRFDAGLHYTVPWSVPLFRITCGPAWGPRPSKKETKGNNSQTKGKEASTDSIMEEIPTFARLSGREGEEGKETFDKIYLWNEGSPEVPTPFLMKHGETHLADLYAMFPKEKAAIDAYLKITDKLMFSLLPFVISKLLPLWLQRYWWRLCLATFRRYGGRTAVEVLGEITDDSRLVALLCGLWIDTGARPDRATFFLTASVFRGLAREGAVYPVGGSETMARCLVDVIEANGGKVLTRASVSRILVRDDTTNQCVDDDTSEEATAGNSDNNKNNNNNNITYKSKEGSSSLSNLRVAGVRINNSVDVPAELVVSSVGYHNTFGRLLSPRVVAGLGMPRRLPGVDDSAGFVMCNVGIRGNSQELRIPNCNLWVHPVDKDTGDMFGPLKRFYADPLAHDPIPAMITFPSLKDQAWEAQHPDKMSCQILVMADYSWFEKYKDAPTGDRGQEYEELKKRWQDKCLQLLFRVYPQVKDRVEFVDVSTPLSIEHYIQSSRGGAVGLDQTPKRYTDWEIVKCLDLKTKLKGLYLTGQDTLVCGVTLAQATGLLTALRIVGPLASARLMLQNIVFGC